MTSAVEACAACLTASEIDRLAPRDRVIVSDGWRVAHDELAALAGWMIVTPIRHVESLDELSEEEASALGKLLRLLSKAMISSLGASKTYVLCFTEAVPHFHLHVLPRMPDLPDDRTGPAILGYHAGPPLTEAERDDIAKRVAAAWPTDLRRT
jgi:diadenosine tetraphosphate (Ap4A) HIT family hydrolase